MRNLIKTTAAGLVLLGGVSAASAQDVIVTPDQETVIREYVTTQEVAPATVPDVEVSVGTTLPDTVELHTMDVPDVQYRYVVVDGRTVLVEPETRRVVHIIQ